MGCLKFPDMSNQSVSILISTRKLREPLKFRIIKILFQIIFIYHLYTPVNFPIFKINSKYLFIFYFCLNFLNIIYKLIF
jgi:hypothetical protein